MIGPNRYNSLLLLLSVFTLLSFVSPSQAFVIQLKSAAAPTPDPAHRFPSWRDTFQDLANLIEDDDFHNSIREYMRDAGDAANYCRFSFVECDESSRITELRLSQLDGLVKWERLPQSTIVVSVENSKLRQPPDFRTTPKWVKSLELQNVTFEPEPHHLEGAVSSTCFVSNPQSMAEIGLKTFVCRQCGLAQVEWDTLPPSLMQLDLSQNKLRGGIVIGSLPSALRSLNFSGCGAAMETALLHGLPKALQVMDFSSNVIAGSIETILFPPNLEIMRLDRNQLTGTLQLDHIPFGVVELDVSSNQLEGSCGDLTPFLSLRHFRASDNQLTSVAWEKLPSQLSTFHVANNRLTGSLPIAQLPLTIESLDVRKNKLSGILNLANLPENLAFCDVSENQLTGRADFTKLGPKIRFLYVQKNRLQGVPDLTLLPVDVRRVLIYENDWDSLMPPL